MVSERRTVRSEREQLRMDQDRDVRDKVRRFREGLMRARYDAKTIERLEHAYEKRLRTTAGG